MSEENFNAWRTYGEESAKAWSQKLEHGIRKFDSGATRDTAEGKPDYAGFQSPLVIRRFGQYMLEHQQQPDGTARASNNWKKGIPRDAYFESLMRHVLDLWLHHEGHGGLARHGLEETLCAIRFNNDGYLDSLLRGGVRDSKEPNDEF